MKNVFIMHTQYNLILSAGILSRYSDAENTLILFSEFDLSNEILSSLSNLYDRVIIAREKFYAPKSALEDIREVRRALRKVRSLKNDKFDNIFMSQERVFDKILCSRFKKNNPNANCYNVEEDAYYSINEKYNAPDFTPKKTRSWKRHLLYSVLLFGHPYNYKDVHYCYGMSEEYHGANVLFPELVRRELKNKDLIEVTAEELKHGIEALYSKRNIAYPASRKYTLFFFDLMNRYRNSEQVKHIVNEILLMSKKEQRTVLFKYHPREVCKFSDIPDAFEIPHIMPAEKILYDLTGKDVVVFGNATTACVVAAKLGFKVISICKLESPTNSLMHEKLSNMGINCITDIEHVKKMI